jgi:hypothetical protein
MENRNGGALLEGLSAYGRIILKWIKEMKCEGLDWMYLAQVQLICDHGNEF